MEASVDADGTSVRHRKGGGQTTRVQGSDVTSTRLARRCSSEAYCDRMSIDSDGPPSSSVSSSSSSLSSVAAAEASSGSAYQTADEGFELMVTSCHSSVDGPYMEMSNGRMSTDGEEELGLVASYSLGGGRDEASSSSGLSSSTPTVDADSIDSAFAVTDREDWTPVVETSAALRETARVGDGERSGDRHGVAEPEYTAGRADTGGVGIQSGAAGRRMQKPSANTHKTTAEDGVSAEGEASVRETDYASDTSVVVVGADVQLRYDSIMPVTSTARAMVVVTPEIIRPVVVAVAESHSHNPLASEATASEVKQPAMGHVSSSGEPSTANPEVAHRTHRPEMRHSRYASDEGKQHVSRREVESTLPEDPSRTMTSASDDSVESTRVITSTSDGSSSSTTVEWHLRNATATPSVGVCGQASINDGDWSEYYRLSHRSMSFDETLTSLSSSADAPVPIPAPRRKRMIANRSVYAHLNRKHSDSQFIVSSRSTFDDGAGGATPDRVKSNAVVEATVRVIDIVVERHETLSAAAGGNDDGLPPLPPNGRQRQQQHFGTDVDAAGGKRTNRSDGSRTFDDVLPAAAPFVTTTGSLTADGERRWSVGNQRQHQHQQQQQHHHHHVNLENLRKSISLK